MTGFRSMLAGLFLGAATVVCALPAQAANTLNQIGAQIEQYPVIRADFVQTKQMAALKKPLVTSGHLVFSRQHGVLWQIEKPYRMSYLLGETRIVEIASDGSRRVRETRDVPGLAQVARVFRAMLGANSDALHEYFDATLQGDPTRWAVELKPRQSKLAQYLTAMHLSGSRFVEEIRISEAGGDSTQIRFANSHGAESLSEADSALFGVEGDGASR